MAEKNTLRKHLFETRISLYQQYKNAIENNNQELAQQMQEKIELIETIITICKNRNRY